MSADKRDDEEKLVFAVDAPAESAAPDSAVEVEPELITTAASSVSSDKAKPHQHPHQHPPPPPRVRSATHEGRPLAVNGEPKLARDLMTRQLLTIGPNDTLESLEEHMEA